MKTLIKTVIILIVVFIAAGLVDARKHVVYVKKTAYSSGRKVKLLDRTHYTVITDRREYGTTYENSSWKYEECERCSGTGHTYRVTNDTNTSVKVCVRCPWCKGTGKRGLSKK